MLKSVSLHFTKNPNVIDLPGKGVNIFVGPNNSGKSLALREINDILTKREDTQRYLVKYFDVDWPTLDGVKNYIKEIYLEKNSDERNARIWGFVESGNREVQQLDWDIIKVILKRKDKSRLSGAILRLFTIRLDGKARFNLTDDRPSGDLISEPENTFSHLFQNDNERERLRRLIFEAIGQYIVIDPTNLRHLRLRLSDIDPAPELEQGLDGRSREFHRNAVYIKDASDGVQAYVGIMLAVVSGRFKYILIDEPEAFLHPPLARMLGKQLSGLVAEEGLTMFAATHSADFLMGCMQATKDVRVVRLDYRRGQSSGVLVDPSEMNMRFRRPLLRSSNLISGLFHDGIVVTESDNDRVFYAEVYHRIVEESENMPAVLFVNAQNKQTMKTLVEPMRKFGVPTVAISDLDIVKDGGAQWTAWMYAAGIPQFSFEAFNAYRRSLLAAFAGVDLKQGGLDLLNETERAAGNEFLSQLREFGLFIVPRGELEGWLPNLTPQGKKTDWVVDVLSKMGDPGSDKYVKPGEGDVWDFVRAIVDWVRNPGRKGMPGRSAAVTNPAPASS